MRRSTLQRSCCEQKALPISAMYHRKRGRPVGDDCAREIDFSLNFAGPLQLREAGMIRSSPQTIIANGTDWRFLNELKRELKN